MFLTTDNDQSFIEEKIKTDKQRLRLPTLTEVGPDRAIRLMIFTFISGLGPFRGILLFRQTLFLGQKGK